MWRSRKVILAAAVLGATAFSPATHARYPDCPTGNAEALMAWRNQAMEAPVSSNNAVLKNINHCFPNEVPACLKRIAADDERQPEAVYGSSYPSEQKRLPSIFQAPGNNPDQFQIPPNIEDIIKGTANPPSNPSETANYRRWKIVKYKSRSTGGFDTGMVGRGQASTESLMLIYIPGNSFYPELNYDRWVNIGLPADQDRDRFNPEPKQKLPKWDDYNRNNGSLPVTLTMLTLQKSANSQKARILFQNFNRDNPSSPIYTGSPSNPDSCQLCHSNGMRAISPLGYFAPGVIPPILDDGNNWMAQRAQNGSTVPQLPSSTQATITDMNNIMSSYGTMDWGTVTEADGKTRAYVDPYAHGPGVGPIAPFKPRDDSFLDSCMNLQTEYTYTSMRAVNTTIKMRGVPPNRDRVKAAMNCGMCHGTARAPINKLFSSTEVYFKILIDRSMPMMGGQALTDSDRLALVNCLYKEQPENDKAWFAQVQCQDTVAKSAVESSGRFPAHEELHAPDDTR